MPLAGRAPAAPTSSTRPEPRYPLDVAFCPDCALVQILEEVPPEQLFVDNYLYFSSFSDALLAHSRDARAAADRGARARARQPRRRDRQERRLPAAQLRRAPACRCSASTRRPDQARRRPRRPACRRCASSSAPSWPARLRAEGQQRRRDHRQQRHGAHARPERLRRRHGASCSPTTASSTIENPYVARPDRPLRVRHDLPRALLLLLVHAPSTR